MTTPAGVLPSAADAVVTVDAAYLATRGFVDASKLDEATRGPTEAGAQEVEKYLRSSQFLVNLPGDAIGDAGTAEPMAVSAGGGGGASESKGAETAPVEPEFVCAKDATQQSFGLMRRMPVDTKEAASFWDTAVGAVEHEFGHYVELEAGASEMGFDRGGPGHIIAAAARAHGVFQAGDAAYDFDGVPKRSRRKPDYMIGGSIEALSPDRDAAASVRDRVGALFSESTNKRRMFAYALGELKPTQTHNDACKAIYHAGVTLKLMNVIKDDTLEANGLGRIVPAFSVAGTSWQLYIVYWADCKRRDQIRYRLIAADTISPRQQQQRLYFPGMMYRVAFLARLYFDAVTAAGVQLCEDAFDKKFTGLERRGDDDAGAAAGDGDTAGHGAASRGDTDAAGGESDDGDGNDDRDERAAKGGPPVDGAAGGHRAGRAAPPPRTKVRGARPAALSVPLGRPLTLTRFPLLLARYRHAVRISSRFRTPSTAPKGATQPSSPRCARCGRCGRGGPATGARHTWCNSSRTTTRGWCSLPALCRRRRRGIWRLRRRRWPAAPTCCAAASSASPRCTKPVSSTPTCRQATCCGTGAAA